MRVEHRAGPRRPPVASNPKPRMTPTGSNAMPRFVVLLRGVNVGKGPRVPMHAFKSTLEGLGYTDVATLLNSGNAVFSAAGRSADRHARRIAEALAASLAVDVFTVVKSSAELAAIVAANPIEVPADGHARCLVAFARDAEALAGLASLESRVRPPERFVVGPGAAYLYCAGGILESEVGAALLGKAGKSATTRNWATTLKLLALCGAGAA